MPLVRCSTFQSTYQKTITLILLTNAIMIAPTIPNGYTNGYTNGQQSESSSEPPHIFVFDYMRTRSHLFWRWISTHPSLTISYHPYLMAGFLGRERVTKGLRHSEKREASLQALGKLTPTDETFDSSTRSLEKEVAQADREVRRQK